MANREAGDSSRTVIEKTVSGFADITNFTGKTLFSTPKTVSIVAATRNTIGYLPLSMVQHTNLRVLKLNNIMACSENVRNGSYPVAVPLGLVWKGELTAPAAAFMKYLNSPQGQRIIIDYEAMPVKQ